MTYPVIDCHGDTFSKKLLFIKNPSYLAKLKAQFPEIEGFIEVTPERIRQANVRIQTQSLYLMPSFMDKPLKHGLKIIALILDFIKDNPDFYLIKEAQHIDLNHKYGILLSIEGLELIEESLDLLGVFYELGVRMIAPNWNRLTPWLSPVTEATGAFSSAKDLAHQLNQMNILLDISHLSDQSVIDFEKMYHGVMIASHSNIRQLHHVPRNLSDDLIEIIKERKGLIGINFYPDFLSSDVEHLKKQYSNIQFTEDFRYDYDYTQKHWDENKCPLSFLWILNMIEYLDKKSALDCIAFGTDFDGIEKYSPGLENYTALPLLEKFLKKMGCSDELIQKIFYKNALRVLQTI